MDLNAIFKFIKNSYWGTLRNREEQKTAIENSINFRLFHNGKQIVYSRVMTDKVFFAYLLDVYVIDAYQGKGLGKLFMDKILSFPTLKHIDRWILATKDAHELYKKFGFEPVKSPEKLMDKISERAKKNK